MKLPLFIAQRYLLAKKSHNLINVITWISIVSVGVAAFAMIFVLSVFNGFNVVISDSIHKLSPDLRVTAVKGKTVDLREFPFDKIKNVKNVEYVLPTITEDALFRNAEKQQIGQIKGVPDEYECIERIKCTMLGNKGFRLRRDEVNFGTPGTGMAYYLGINPNRPYTLVQVYVPRRGNASSFNLENSFNNGQLYVNQCFSTQQEVDDRLVLAPFQWLAGLMEYDSLSSDIEVFISQNGKDTPRVTNTAKKEIRKILGHDFKVEDQYEQQATLYRMMRSEKLAVYLILTFILIMAAFNVVGSLTMLIIEKKKDTSTLRAMGADNALIHNIFLNEGTLISVVGGIIGLVLGIIAVLLQQYVGIIRLGDGTGNYIVDYYPVALKFSDIIVVFATISVIGGIAAWTTVKTALKHK